MYAVSGENRRTREIHVLSIRFDTQFANVFRREFSSLGSDNTCIIRFDHRNTAVRIAFASYAESYSTFSTPGTFCTRKEARNDFSDPFKTENNMFHDPRHAGFSLNNDTVHRCPYLMTDPIKHCYNFRKRLISYTFSGHRNWGGAAWPTNCTGHTRFRGVYIWHVREQKSYSASTVLAVRVSIRLHLTYERKFASVVVYVGDSRNWNGLCGK